VRAWKAAAAVPPTASRGCPWTNAYSELGPTNAAVAAEVDHHEREFRDLVTRVVLDAGYIPEIADVIYLLVAGSDETCSVTTEVLKA
jgi:hypothetical protein